MPVQFQLLDRSYFLRRILFVWIIAVTTYILFWMLDFAKTSPRSGAEVAMILGAVNGPLVWLVTNVLNTWKEIGTQPAPTPPQGESLLR